MPIGRSINPITGTNWEGKGVAPDISVPQEQAFQVAYHLALKSILATLGEAPTGPYGNLTEEIHEAFENNVDSAIPTRT